MQPSFPIRLFGRSQVAKAIGMCSIALLATLMIAGTAQASVAKPPKVDLGAAGKFAVLSGSGITNSGSSAITGDAGSSPTPTQTGFAPTCSVTVLHCVALTGVNHTDLGLNDAATQDAKAAVATAYDDAAARPSTTVGTELGGQTLPAGVYSTASGTLGITGNLVLDGKNDADSVFIFQAASTLVTAVGSSVTLINGAQACNVFWKVGSSATLGTSSSLKGTILALASISLGDGVAVHGGLHARNGAVTMIHNTITSPSTCIKQADVNAAAAAAALNTTSTMHINDGSTIGAFCPTASQDTTIPQLCGHLAPIVIGTAGTYTVSVTVACSSYPSSADLPCGAQTVTPTLCLEQSGALAPTGNCPISSPGSLEGTETEANCTQNSTLNTDGSTTYTITCLVVPGTYELLLVPNFVDTCPAFLTDPGCGVISGGPGVDVLITTLFTPSGTIAAESAKAKGSGQVGDGQKFHFHAWNDLSRWSKTQVRFQIKSNDATRCTFVANSATNVQIVPDGLGGGTADIDGLGTVTDSLGQKTSGIPYHVHALDGGAGHDHSGMGDTFQLTAAGCSNLTPALTHGNVDVDAAH